MLIVIHDIREAEMSDWAGVTMAGQGYGLWCFYFEVSDRQMIEGCDAIESRSFYLLKAWQAMAYRKVRAHQKP